MKKNKKINDTQFWKQWIQSPDFSRSLFVLFVLFVLLSLSIFIIWKRYTERGIDPPQALLRSSLVQNKEMSLQERKELIAQSEERSLSDRLTVLENSIITQQQKTLETPQQLVFVELLRAVLDGVISLETLKTFLQKNQDPWAHSLLKTLDPIKESKTYPQLEALFTLKKTPSSSLWKRVKEKVKSFVRIQKLDEKEAPPLGNLKDVQKALRMHDLERVLECYAHLPSQEKEQFASWREMVEVRFTLERALKKLLTDLAEG